MGIFTKALGLDKKGSISLQVESKSYFAGDTVVGTIHVTVTEPITCDALVLKASGTESMRWVEMDDNNRRHREKNYTIFTSKIVIASIAWVYQPGSYSYPFEYQLPSDLPGVFSLHDYGSKWVADTYADITYKLKATLDVKGVLARDLKAVTAIQVHQRLLQAVQPSEDSVTKSVRLLCCINKGKCHLSMKLDRNAYNPGATVSILSEITNVSQVDITAMRIRLYQDVIVTPVWGKRPLKQAVATFEFPGVAAGKSLSQPQLLRLLASDGTATNASTDGKFIKCSYRIEVECDNLWCPDVVLHLPVTLVQPGNL